MCIYLPPHNSPIYKRYVNDLLHDIANYTDKGNIRLCGDFNARCGNTIDYIEDSNSLPKGAAKMAVVDASSSSCLTMSTHTV